MDPALAVVLTALVAGFLCARLRVMPEGAPDAFNRYVVYVCLPAVVLRIVPKLTFSRELGLLVFMPWALLALSVGAVLGLSRLFGFRREVTGALLLCVPLGNTSFLGFPMVSALLGPDSVRLAVLYDQLGSFLILATYGLVIVARYSGAEAPSPAVIARRVATFPPFLALLAAFVPVSHPALLDAVLKVLGDTLVPIALFAVGLKVTFSRPRDAGALTLGLATKMLVSPLVASGIAAMSHATEAVRHVAVLEAAMPPMITAGALAVTAGLAPELASGLVAYGVLVSLATLPFVAWLLQR